MNKLPWFQNRALRIITNFEFDTHAEPPLRETGILNITELIRYEKLAYA